jgi:hypothetical protein
MDHLKLMQFRSILALSADDPHLLRPCDVERVLDAAVAQGCFREFRTWLLSHDLQERTRSNIKTFEA